MSTTTIERPVAVADSGPIHIIEPVTAVVRQVADAAILNQGGRLDHPNRVALRAFVEREIVNARKMHPAVGRQHLAATRLRITANQTRALARGKTPTSLIGLTAFDFGMAIMDVDAALSDMRGVDPRQVAA